MVLCVCVYVHCQCIHSAPFRKQHICVAKHRSGHWISICSQTSDFCPRFPTDGPVSGVEWQTATGCSLCSPAAGAHFQLQWGCGLSSETPDAAALADPSVCIWHWDPWAGEGPKQCILLLILVCLWARTTVHGLCKPYGPRQFFTCHVALYAKSFSWHISCIDAEEISGLDPM